MWGHDRRVTATRTLSSPDRDRPARLASLTEKVLIALTGALLTGWVFLHMAGTLGVFAGAETMNGYAQLLRDTNIALAQRLFVVAAIVVHSWLSLRLVLRTRKARPIPYAQKKHASSTWAGRSMRFTGPLVLAWLVYHVLHLYGPAHPDYIPGDVHHNLVTGLASPWVAGSYVVATFLFVLHLEHGLTSALQTWGVPSSVRQAASPVLRGFVVILGVGFLLPVVAAQAGYW